MALGVSSYSQGGGRRRRPEPGPYGPRHPFRNQLAAVEQALVRGWPLLRLPLSLLALAHVVLVALLPGGRNALLGIPPASAPTYATLFQVPDVLGFYATNGTDGFIVYKIYTQDGGTVDGIFPDAAVSPRLRYDRWAAAGDAASGPYPELHAYVARLLVSQLPSPPLRLELFAARWSWDRNSLTFPWPGNGPETTLELTRLGTYNGLTRAWEPLAAKGGSR